jgi:hypothetical protein
MKLAYASWHTPILACECPYCGQWQDLWKQFREHESPFNALESVERSELIDIEFECEKCHEIFELEYVEW